MGRKRKAVYQEVANSELQSFSLENRDTVSQVIAGRARMRKPILPCLKVFRQSNSLRVKWDLFVMGLAVWNCFSIPFSLCFAISPESVETSNILDAVIDLIFFIDIAVVFNTTYISSTSGTEEFKRSKIAAHYVTSGNFFIDLMATVPFDTFAHWAGGPADTLSALGLLKLTRILRLSKIIMFMRVMEKFKIYIRLLQLMLLLLMYLHLCACVWHLIVTDKESWWPSTNTIVADPLYYSADVEYQYFLAFYTSVSLLVGIEVMPQDTVQMAFACAMILLGAMISAMMFGQMVILMSALNKKGNVFNEKITTANTAMNNMRIDASLQFEIIDYLISTHENSSHQAEYEKFKEIIPPSLIKQVNKAIYNDIVINTPVFCHFEQATGEILKDIKNEFKKPEELIINQGDPAECMMFLVSGELKVMLETLNGPVVKIRTVLPREYFGEIGVLFHSKRTATIMVTCYANVGYVAKRDFDRIMYKYPDAYAALRKRAVSMYKEDPTRRYFLKTVRRLPYFKSLDLPVLFTLMYHLSEENYVAGEYIYKTGSTVDKVVFIYEGQVALTHVVYDGAIKRRIQFFNRQNAADSESNGNCTGSFSLSRSKGHLKLRDSIEMDWCLLGPGSIVGWREALFRQVSRVNLECKQNTRVFVLKLDDIEEIARTETQLRSNLETMRAKYTLVDRVSREKQVRTPVLDCHCLVSHHERNPRVTNNLIRLKSSVLGCILRKRDLREMKLINMKALIRKLEAIVKAEKKGWVDVAKQIEIGAINPDVIENCDILRHDELSNSVLCQFASTTKELIRMQQELNREAEQAYQFTTRGTTEQAFLREQVEFLREAIKKL